MGHLFDASKGPQVGQPLTEAMVQHLRDRQAKRDVLWGLAIFAVLALPLVVPALAFWVRLSYELGSWAWSLVG